MNIYEAAIGAFTKSVPVQASPGGSGTTGSSCVVPALGLAPALYVCRTGPGQIPTYASTLPFPNPAFSQGSDVRLSANKFADDLNTFDDTVFPAAFANGKWTAKIEPNAINSPLIGQTASFVGVQIISDDIRFSIKNLTIAVKGGNVTGAAPTSTQFNRISMQNQTASGVQNFFAILPLLRAEVNTQRTNLVKQGFSFAAGPPIETTGLEIDVEQLSNNAAFSVTTFLPNRAFVSMVSYGRLIGVGGA